MDISIVIVNYNVKYFLEQALRAIERASTNLLVETIVVDNNSKDGSIQMLEIHFPAVHLIQNKENVGFSVANNQGFKAAKGKYILILNPDTVIQESTLISCFKQLEEDSTIGALGVRMIDGAGQFLPESKRGLPTPWVALYKMLNLHRFLPSVARFNKYYAGHLKETETGEIDVLAGAFMFTRKDILDKIDGFDEAFFMYGEDIDLSYRIQKEGYKIVYFPTETILHYKGESTRKNSIKYIKHFHEAMLIFSSKHFPSKSSFWFGTLLQIGVIIQAIGSFMKSIFSQFGLIIADLLLFSAILIGSAQFWESWYFQDPDYYKDIFYYFNIPLYLSIWLSSIYLFGGHEDRFQVKPFTKGLLLGTLLILAVYGLLDSTYRSSRAIILLATAGNLMLGYALRKVLIIKSKHNPNLKPRTVLVGSIDESLRAKKLLLQAEVEKDIIGTVSPTPSKNEAFIGDLSELENLVFVFKIKEVIFCAQDISSESILYWMRQFGNQVQTRILPTKGETIIGSYSKNSLSEIYTISIQFNLQKAVLRRQKRVLDFSFACLYLLLSPILIWKKSARKLFPKVFQVLFNSKTWVGYPNQAALPILKKAIFNVEQHIDKPLPKETIRRLHFLYAKDYSLNHDIEVILKLFWKNFP